MMINKYYGEKCEELQQRYFERTDKFQTDVNELKTKINELGREEKPGHEDLSYLKLTIDDIKRDIKQFEENGILIDIQPLINNKDLIQIKEWTFNGIDISTLSAPIRTIDCSNENWPSMTGNNRYLLIDQYPNLHLYDKEWNLVKQFPWKYNRIFDMCWSSTLNSFIILTEKYEVFLVNEDMTSAEPIKSIGKQKMSSCTCSNTSLFVTTAHLGSNIFEFNLLSSFQLIKQWNPPKSCDELDWILNIVYNNGTLGLLMQTITKSFRLEVRCSTTSDRLWTLHLPDGMRRRISRICLLKWNEWLVIDNNSSDVLHITKGGQLKMKHKWESIPENAVLFGGNILAIRSTKWINLFNV
jgi:hypothetical protein